MLDLNDLRVFAYVAELKSFSETAAALDIDKSSVSRYLSRLEEQLGSQLVDRSTRKVQLTAAGMQLRERCGELLAFISERIGDVGPLGINGPEVLRVDFSRAIGASTQSSIVVEFARLHPNCRVLLSASVSSNESLVPNEQADIAISLGPPQLHRGPIFGRLDQVICASPVYLRNNVVLPSPTGLDGHKIVAASASPRAIYEALALHRRNPLQVEISPHMIVEDSTFALQLVIDGAGVGCFIREDVIDALNSGALVRLFAEATLTPQYVSATFPSGKQFSPVITRFLNILKNRFGIAAASESSSAT